MLGPRGDTPGQSRPYPRVPARACSRCRNPNAKPTTARHRVRLQHSGAVLSLARRAKDLLPSVAENPRNLSLAQNVRGVFHEYERRLRSLGVLADMSGLGKPERDLIAKIAKHARTALTGLEQGRNNLDANLDRAYKNADHIDQDLRDLSRSFKIDSRPHAAAVAECYRAAHVVPPLPDNLHLDFTSRHESGKFCAPEGLLKSTYSQVRQPTTSLLQEEQ